MTVRSLWLPIFALASMALDCGGKVTVDVGDGLGGAAGAGPGPSTSPATSTVATGPGPTTSVGPTSSVASSNASSGAGGASHCFGCAEYITDCIATDQPAPTCGSDPMCEGSARLFDDLKACVCAFCAMECFYACQGQAGDDPDLCGSCQQNATSSGCANEFAQCANDI